VTEVARAMVVVLFPTVAGSLRPMRSRCTTSSTSPRAPGTGSPLLSGEVSNDRKTALALMAAGAVSGRRCSRL
jgi:hypothetical protein